MNTEIVINDFQGPLDLLLSLIDREKIDILNIPIAEITDQYNQIIKSWNVYDLDEVSEYLIMAARLIQIKIQMVLPRPRRGNEVSDPRAELTNQLLEYKALKKISEFLCSCDIEESKSFIKDPEYFQKLVEDVSVDFKLSDLEKAMRRLMEEKENEPSIVSGIKKDIFTVEEQAKRLREILFKEETFNFRSIFRSKVYPEEVIVTFLAVLELYKTGEMDFEQDDGEIILKRREDYQQRAY